MSFDEIELDTLGDRKTELFIIISDKDSYSMLFTESLQLSVTNLLDKPRPKAQATAPV
jgi:type IV secretion system protein VirD4